MNNQTALHQQQPAVNPTLPTGQTNPTTATPPPASPNTGQVAVSPPAEGPQTNTNPTPGTQVDVGGGPPPGGGGGGPNPGNFGQPLYPWLMPYGGQFTAPMSPFEQNAMGGYFDFLNGGMGLNSSRDYLNNVLSGQYVDLNRNPYIGQISDAMRGLKDYEDTQGLARLRSSSAAGGSAMGGAELGAESDFLRNSGNQFNALMGQLMNENYARERGFQTQAPGQEAGLSSLLSQGYGQGFNMGGLPRQLQQNDLNAQYQDYLRQVNGMQQMFQYPDTLTNQLLYGGGFRGQTPNQYGNSFGEMLTGLLGQGGGNIDWSGILNGIGGLFGGGGSGTSDPMVQSYDGTPMGYDATPTFGPRGYGDAGWYNQQLTNQQNQMAAQQAKNQNGPNSTALGILALLMQLLPKKKSGSSNAFKPGVGGGGGGNQNQQKQNFLNPGAGTNWSQSPINDYSYGTGSNINPNDPFLGGTPQYPGESPGSDNPANPFSDDPRFDNLYNTGGGSPYDIFPGGGSDLGNPSDPFGGGGGFDNPADLSGPTDFGGLDLGGFDPGSSDFGGGDFGSEDF
jgi:hypothetical protein